MELHETNPIFFRKKCEADFGGSGVQFAARPHRLQRRLGVAFYLLRSQPTIHFTTAIRQTAFMGAAKSHTDGVLPKLTENKHAGKLNLRVERSLTKGHENTET